MHEFDSVPLNGTYVLCERCLTESNKFATIAQMLAQKPSGSDAVIIVRCVGCEFEIPLVLSGQHGIAALRTDPYQDTKPVAVKTEEILPAPIALDDASADDRYRIGQAAFAQENYKRAYAFWRSAFEWYITRSGTEVLASALLSNMGMALSRLNDPQGALKCFRGALDHMGPSDNAGYATVLNNVGAAYLHLGQMGEAEDFHRRAYECHLKHNSSDPALVARERSNLAFTYAKLAKRNASSKDLTTAVRYARQAVALYPIASLPSEARVYCLMLGNLLRRHAETVVNGNDSREAISRFRESISVHEQCGAGPEIMAAGYSRLAEAQRCAGLLDEALQSLQRVDELLEMTARRRVPLMMLKKRNPLAVSLLQLIRPCRRFWTRSQLAIDQFRHREWFRRAPNAGNGNRDKGKGLP